ncbi:hypothetical protein OE88DRAFT_1351498 [Heliocybe sulcata]|uniref:Uncharacterized protein n=1 Tax=Heliocybe sulcata TaxID=5364 RepID=A0A5C3N5U3_9AGAM|nr:hypothetical protein OE88DRAFT_1351498 [Heliocybe sulcata]
MPLRYTVEHSDNLERCDIQMSADGSGRKLTLTIVPKGKLTSDPIKVEIGLQAPEDSVTPKNEGGDACSGRRTPGPETQQILDWVKSLPEGSATEPEVWTDDQVINFLVELRATNKFPAPFCTPKKTRSRLATRDRSPDRGPAAQGPSVSAKRTASDLQVGGLEAQRVVRSKSQSN